MNFYPRDVMQLCVLARFVLLLCVRLSDCLTCRNSTKTAKVKSPQHLCDCPGTLGFSHSEDLGSQSQLGRQMQMSLVKIDSFHQCFSI